MKLISLEFKNVGSYGDDLQKLKFTDDADLVMINGANGKGKTTIAKALKFGLFGKVDNMRLQDLPNRVNKKAYVKIKLIANNSNITVIRGHSPSKFELWIDGKEIDKAGNRDVQKYLEEEYLGFNFSVFTNILILSINDFKSFLTMKPSDKRKIIDRIFGFDIINQMREEIKKERKDLKSNLNRIDEALNQINSTIKHTLERIDNLKAESKKKNSETILLLENEVKESLEKKEKLDDKSKKLSQKLTSKIKEKNTKNSTIAELLQEGKSLKKKLDLYNNSSCPTCHSPLDTPFHKEIINQAKEDIENLKVAIRKDKSDLELIEQEINKARGFENNLVKEIQKLESLVQAKRQEILKFNKDNNTKDLENLVVDFENQKQSKTSELMEFNEDENFLSILETDVLSDDGVKSLAIKAIVPVLNKTIEKYSSDLNSPFNIEFDENFNCIVKELGEEIHPSTLSEGERKKADLIIIISMIEILKLRYPSMNLLFLDELFSSLDQETINNILFVLKKMISKLNINIFVISHTELPVQLFDKIIHVYKKSNFSNFNVYTDLAQLPEDMSSDK